MTFLEQLQSHKGGLLYLKTGLYWYGGRGYDRSPGRICLILDATQVTASRAAAAVPAVTPTAEQRETADALLLIDGSPHWVWMADSDVELLPEKL